jgi:hypothetical protein
MNGISHYKSKLAVLIQEVVRPCVGRIRDRIVNNLIYGCDLPGCGLSSFLVGQIVQPDKEDPVL